MSFGVFDTIKGVLLEGFNFFIVESLFLHVYNTDDSPLKLGVTLMFLETCIYLPYLGFYAREASVEDLLFWDLLVKFEFSLSEFLLIMDELKLLLFSDKIIFSDSSRTE